MQTQKKTYFKRLTLRVRINNVTYFFLNLFAAQFLSKRTKKVDVYMYVDYIKTKGLKKSPLPEAEKWRTHKRRNSTRLISCFSFLYCRRQKQILRSTYLKGDTLVYGIYRPLPHSVIYLYNI